MIKNYNTSRVPQRAIAHKASFTFLAVSYKFGEVNSRCDRVCWWVECDLRCGFQQIALDALLDKLEKQLYLLDA
jgi:hypothetical protein